MGNKPKILVVGSFVMDLIVTTSRFPEAGETVIGAGFSTAPGGKGANQAIQAARLGADVTMVGKVGKDDFGKRMKKELIEALTGTEYAPLAPYYAVTANGFLSDEYELMTVEQSKTETVAFLNRMEQEELLAEPITGTIIAKCPDGDRVLLKADGAVARFNHEIPEETERWKNLAEFISNAIAADEKEE